MDATTAPPAPSVQHGPVDGDPAGVLSPLVRWLYVGAGFGCIGLAILGAMLPGLPTTVFVILAAGCFGRSSPRLEQWLLDHPRFGPSLRAWRARGAIPRRAKAIAITSMAASGVVTAVTAPWFVGLGVGIVLVSCALYVGTRPHE